MTKRETVAALLEKLNGTFEQWNDGGDDVESSLFIDLYDTLRALAEYALDLDERLRAEEGEAATLKEHEPERPDTRYRGNVRVHNTQYGERPEAQSQRLKDWYFSVDDCIYETLLTELCDGAKGVVSKVGRVNTRETAHCYVQPTSPADAAPDGEEHRCFQCGISFDCAGSFFEVCNKCRDTAQEDGP